MQAGLNRANVTRQLPADIQRMGRKRLQGELDPVNSYGIDDDQHLRLALHLQREGYGGHAAPLAMGFLELAGNITLREFRQAHPPKPDLIRIIGRCGAMNHQLQTGGADAGYEQWRATLSILKFCNAGADEVEALTGQHADYDPDVTARKMADISAPFRCDTFNASECEGCKFRGAINSPISLGFSREPKAKKAGQR